MPEQPESKRRPQLCKPRSVRAAGLRTPYAELHCKTNFSFLEGASHPDELVNRAAELSYAALAITDRNTLAGVVRAHRAAKQCELKLLIGAELTPVDAPAVLLYATDRPAYGRLSRLITLGRRNAPKGECHLTFDDIADHADGLIAGIVGSMVSSPIDLIAPGSAGGLRTARIGLHTVLQSPGRAGGYGVYCENNNHDALNHYREVFGDRCYLFAELHCGPNDARRLAERIELANAAQLPLVAANDVHFHHPSRRALADVLCCTRVGCTISTAGDLLFPNAVRHLKSPQEMRELFARVPDALRRTVEIANRCTFSLDELRYEYPEELAPAGETPLAYLTRLTWQGAANRYPTDIPEKVRRLLEHELQLIGELRYEAYFLTVWDLVKFARAREILCQGRGSAANSAVCYCLGVTSVDPDRMEVLFERFISRERNEVPDIDVDFEHERREEVIQYVYEKYGRERAGMTAEVITYRPRSAVRDVGKALGLSLDRVDTLAKTLDRGGMKQLVERFPLAGLDPESQVSKQLLGLVGELLGFPRHLGQHVGGLVITQFPLCELVPIENAAMENRTVIEWDKDDLDELGILKVDCLSLGMLTAIHKCFDFVNEVCNRQASGERFEKASPLATHPSPLTLATVPAEDPATYEMICQADTMGVFQIESRAQMSMLPRLRPRKFYDIVIQVAIVRPGPIQGDMVHPYLRRRAGEEAITYPNDEIREVLKRTLGVPLFQEQAMQLAVVAAGFTPGEADQLRRAMAAWRRPGIIDSFRQKLLDGMRARNLSEEFADRLYKEIRGFGEYGFPESHAASFALLAYVSAWLKCHYPAAFCAALLNSQPMGFYAPAQLVRDAKAHGVEVGPVDVNHSRWDCTLEKLPLPPQGEGWGEGEGSNQRTDSRHTPKPRQTALRLGLRMIVGLPQAQALKIEQARGEKPFHSLDDFQRRSGVRATVVERLARADAFQSLALDRRDSLWQSLEQAKETQHRPLWENAAHQESPIALPTMSPEQEVQIDYQTAGLSLKGHPLSFYRAELNKLRITPAKELANSKNGLMVRVAGLVLVRQRPGTAKGITFVTIEDETGVANLIIRMDVWERFYQVARTAHAYIAHGRLQKHQGVIHVLVTKLENLSQQLNELRIHSRDFQ